MDLEDRRIRHDTPKIKCHERKNKRKGMVYHWKTKGKTKCPNKETTKIQKPAQINPLMTVLMSSRPQLDQTTVLENTCTERMPLTAYRTVVLELPENLQYKPAVKKPIPSCKSTRKCIVPDFNKLKLNLRW
ncbi:uncharacterized protein LOC112684866 isoform X2 [Sipha flava]|nr:uncharacterized protein LOC112684866 isoform X2 [Sipha flava]